MRGTPSSAADSLSASISEKGDGTSKRMVLLVVRHRLSLCYHRRSGAASAVLMPVSVYFHRGTFNCDGRAAQQQDIRSPGTSAFAEFREHCRHWVMPLPHQVVEGGGDEDADLFLSSGHSVLHVPFRALRIQIPQHRSIALKQRPCFWHSARGQRKSCSCSAFRLP